MIRQKPGVALIVAGLLVLGSWTAGAAEENEGTLCEPVLVDSGVEAYGMLVTFRPGQLMILPDFRLRADPSTPESAEFTVWMGKNQDLQRLRWPRSAEPVPPLEFTLGGKVYVLELDRSVLQYRPLARNELVVWPKAEYLAKRDQSKHTSRSP